jgi:hypothetical protein
MRRIGWPMWEVTLAYEVDAMPCSSRGMMARRIFFAEPTDRLYIPVDHSVLSGEYLLRQSSRERRS